MLMQFINPDNAKAHRETTGPEIWDQTDGKIDIFVAGIGTGGTMAGCGEYLKGKKPSLYTVAVEPTESAVISGKPKGPHKIMGIGAGFVPQVYEAGAKFVDEVLPVSSDSAL